MHLILSIDMLCSNFYVQDFDCAICHISYPCTQFDSEYVFVFARTISMHFTLSFVSVKEIQVVTKRSSQFLDVFQVRGYAFSRESED